MPPLEAWPAPGQHLPYTTFLSSRVSVADRRSRYPNHTGTPVDSTQSKGKGFSKSTRTIHRGCPGWTHLHQPASGSPGPGRPLKKKVQGNDQESRSTGCRTNGGSRGAPSSHPQPLDGTSHTTQLHVTPGVHVADLFANHHLQILDTQVQPSRSPNWSRPSLRHPRSELQGSGVGTTERSWLVTNNGSPGFCRAKS